jgi:hypothetical protein
VDDETGTDTAVEATNATKVTVVTTLDHPVEHFTDISPVSAAPA